MEVHVLSKKGFGGVHAEAFHPSPLHFPVGDSAPASPANGQSVSLDLNVHFDVTAPAFLVPRVSAFFHFSQLQISDLSWNIIIFVFKVACETTFSFGGEMS
jgi:hypothetical protein